MLKNYFVLNVVNFSCSCSGKVENPFPKIFIFCNSAGMWWWAYNYHKNTTKHMALNLIQPERVQDLIRQRPKMDAMVTMMQGNAIFADIFNCPIINFSPFPVHFNMLGTTNVINYNIQPFPLMPLIEPMAFLDRLLSSSVSIGTTLYMSWHTSSLFTHQQEFLRNTLGLESRDPKTILRERSALLLSGSHPITHGAWQYLPNVIEVSL